MDYTIKQFALLTGVSARTLRYYEEIGLLAPQSKTDAGYRMYSSQQADTMQQIMLYKRLGMRLSEIKSIITDENFDGTAAMEQHLEKLNAQKEQIERLIENVSQTISAMKGEIYMADSEKFTAFITEKIRENEKKYGKEIRKKYGDEKIDGSNKKLMEMSEKKWNDIQRLEQELNSALKKAAEAGDPSSETAQRACMLHKEWIQHYWNFYSKEAHLGLCEMYTRDERFKGYYEKIAPGCADFLLEAMKIYLK